MTLSPAWQPTGEATPEGLSLLAENNFKFRLEETRFQPAPFGGRYDVRAICEDREGSVWLGTYATGWFNCVRPPSE